MATDRYAVGWTTERPLPRRIRVTVEAADDLATLETALPQAPSETG